MVNWISADPSGSPSCSPQLSQCPNSPILSQLSDLPKQRLSQAPRFSESLDSQILRASGSTRFCIPHLDKFLLYAFMLMFTYVPYIWNYAAACLARQTYPYGPTTLETHSNVSQTLQDAPTRSQLLFHTWPCHMGLCSQWCRNRVDKNESSPTKKQVT